MSGSGIDRVVIIGTGQGGLQLAASLRQEGFAGAITLIGDEPGLPYQRPPLSKTYMKEGNPDRLLLKPATFYESAGIRVLESTRAVAIDRAARQVLTADGRRHDYDHLVLATGARNSMPPVTGTDQEHVVGLRTLADAEAIRRRLPAIRRAVVIGGGFIGLEFASVARAAGVEVTVIEAQDRLMARAVSPPISARFLDAHRAAGAGILLESLAATIAPPGAESGVTLATGEHVGGDLVLIATGVVPNTELAAEAGLAVENGIAVDESLRTADPAISAIGDCASVPGPDGSRIRLESVQAAVDHARHVARQLATGETRPYAAVPWFWSDQGELKLQIAGLAPRADRQTVLPEEGPVETVLGFRGDHLVSVETVNAPGPHMAARKLFGLGPVSLAEVEGSGFDLRALAKGRAASG